MKTFMICSVVAGLSFVGMGYQTGLFRNLTAQVRDDEGDETDAPKAVASKAKAKAAKSKFPEDLAPAARAKPVEKAGSFKPGPDVHKLVFMKPDGSLHKWNEEIHDEWQASTVESTSLVVVVGPMKKQFVQKITYPNNAPPIIRTAYEVEVSVIEPKTGKILAFRTFRNEPRQVYQVEDWATTAIGRPINWQTVFRWLSSATKVGFPDEIDVNAKIVNVIE
jgi:hypothetical protein